MGHRRRCVHDRHQAEASNVAWRAVRVRRGLPFTRACRLGTGTHARATTACTTGDSCCVWTIFNRARGHLYGNTSIEYTFTHVGTNGTGMVPWYAIPSGTNWNILICTYMCCDITLEYVRTYGTHVYRIHLHDCAGTA